MAQSQTVAKADVESLNNMTDFSVEATTFGTSDNVIQVPCDLDGYEVSLIQAKGYTLAFTCNDNLIFKKE